MFETLLLSVFTVLCVTIFEVFRCQNRPQVPKNFAHLLDREERRGPQNYNPNYGYEPYWVDGIWVFKEPVLPANVSSTSMPQICGEECNYLYREIKNVCGRMTNDWGYSGCKCKVPWGACSECKGHRIDDLSQGFKTFSTYCEFLDKQCRSSFNERWILVHMGECITPQDLFFKPISVADQIVSRQQYYLTRQSEVFHNYTTLPPLPMNLGR